VVQDKRGKNKFGQLFALHAGLPVSTINNVGAVYTAARVAYGAAYILIESDT